MLDEPLSALDFKLRKEMQIELKRLQTETGITFIFVTHDQEEALTMSDRIAVMNAGKILQIGGPRDIYDHPAERFVADFIGDTNFLEADVVSVDGDDAQVQLGVGQDDCRARAVEGGCRIRQGDAGRAARTCRASGWIRRTVARYAGRRRLFRDGHAFPRRRWQTATEFVVRQQNQPEIRRHDLATGDRVGVGFAPDVGQVLRD